VVEAARARRSSPLEDIETLRRVQMSATSGTDGANRKPGQPIRFTIDGRPFEVTDASQTAAALLHLAGLDPNGYDLGQLHGNNPKPKQFGDEAKVHVNEGDRFVSIRERAAVA
jgi:hypothetical protein